MDHKQYNSIFVPEDKIDLANYITELIIKNWCNWQKIQAPNCPFWRKEIVEKNPHLKELSKRYIAELGAVNKLLYVFSPTVLMTYIKDKNVAGFQLFKNETKKKILFDLYQAQYKYLKNLEGISRKEIQFSDNKSEYTKRKSYGGKTKFGQL